MVLVEGLINAYFFSKSSDLGLLGGWIQAITVAFTNVITAFFLIGFLGLRLLQNPTAPSPSPPPSSARPWRWALWCS
ncbi:MAG: hypothetical protein JKP95_00655 [Oceanicaulis sp.]|nr:hypothetical protein [Oceanicaulis sp.]